MARNTEAESGLTPMMQQYNQIHQRVPDSILFFRLGDFYEMFGEDARTAARELDLTLTTRDHSNPDPETQIPMCGIPFHAYESYLSRLVARGYRVAICEQMEDPALAKGLVKREIIRVVTPGTVTESAMLEENRNNYMALVWKAPQQELWGLSFCDISTGAFYVTSAEGDDAEDRVLCELGRFSPAEIRLGGGAGESRALSDALGSRITCPWSMGEPEWFTVENAGEMLRRQYPERTAELSALSQIPAELLAAGAMVSVLLDCRMNALRHLRLPERILAGQYMELDLATRRNLELTETIRSREKKGTLLWVLDRTNTAMGGRMLRAWLERPLLSVAEIRRRQSAVTELTEKGVDREELRRLLRNVSDLERVIGRISTGSANARDMRALADGAEDFPAIREMLGTMSAPMLRGLYERFDTLDDIRQTLSRAIVDDPPVSIREGGMIRAGYNAELDEYHDLLDGGKTALAAMETRERDRTGIRTLRVRYNRVYGYYIEVSNSFRDQVPENYVRRQTLTNAERYFTPELKELEEKLLTARDRVTELEGELFAGLREWLTEQSERILTAAAMAAQTDVLCCLADTAVRYGYACPEVDTSGVLSIRDGRHPVVERMLSEGFVANSTELGEAGNRTAIITGPNMAGKSTYMRQVALITLMAQIGSFVPAASARIGITDRIFTRIGASDDLGSGQSTFMVEMTEVAEILRCATRDSLLIFDEIGRGTSTFDGMAIARAVVEHAADRKKLGARTLFATHYHELTDLETEDNDIKNYNIAVRKREGRVVFLRRIVPGPADESLGVEVAKMAGLPESVIRRAREILKALEAGEEVRSRGSGRRPAEAAGQISLTEINDTAIRHRLENLQLDTLTPLEAMMELDRLKHML